VHYILPLKGEGGKREKGAYNVGSHGHRGEAELQKESAISRPSPGKTRSHSFRGAFPEREWKEKADSHENPGERGTSSSA